MADNQNLDAMLTAASWDGISGSQVREFLQGFMSKLDKEKVGYHHFSRDNGTVTIRSFADSASFDRWEAASDEDKNSNLEIQSLVLGMIQFKEGGVADGYTFSPKLKRGPASTIVRGGSCCIVFTYDCYYTADMTPDTEKGRVVVQVNGSTINELTQDLVPDKNKEVTVDFGKYLTSDTNSVKVIISNRYGQSRAFTYTINTIKVALELPNYKEDSLRTEDSWGLQIRNNGNAAKVYVQVDNKTPMSISIATGGMMGLTINEPTPGAHKLTVWGEIEEYGLVSTPIVRSFVRSGNASAVCIGADAVTSVAHYGDISIPFFAYLPAMANSIASISYRAIGPNGESLKPTATLDVAIGANGMSGTHTINVSTMDEVFEQCDEIKVLISKVVNGVEYSAMAIVQLTPAGVKLAPTPQCAIHFTASGHSNADADRGSWLTLGEGQTCSLSLSSNFRLTNDEGFVNGGFLIPRGKTLTFDGLKPFLNDVGVNAGAAGGTGKTIEFEFKVKNCTNVNTSIIRCMHNGVGFDVTANRAVLSTNTNSVETFFADETRIRIGICIEGTTHTCVNKIPGADPVTSYKNIAYLYVNGIPVRIMEYGADKWVQAIAQNIEVGSDSSDIELYTMRVYDRALTFREMLANYSYDTPVLSDKVAIARRNDIFNTLGEVDYAKVRDALKDTPIKVWEFAEMPQDKKNWKKCNTQFINPAWDANPSTDNLACASFECVNHDFALDGTSSLSYPDPYKNWADKYNGTWKVRIGDTEIAITGYSLTENAPTSLKVIDFVDKVNFASSEGIFNILAAHMYHDILLGCAPTYRDLLTAPQEAQYIGADGATESVDNISYRQSLDGFPIIGFRKVTENGVSTNQFLSIYNFVNNKYDPSYFGFDKSGDTEAWEVEDNLNIFATELKEGEYKSGSWDGNATELYYARFPEKSPVSGSKAKYGVPNTEGANDVAIARQQTQKIRRFHNWVYSINTHVAERYYLLRGSYAPLASPATYGDKTFTMDTPEYRKQKFLAEYPQYLNKASALLFFNFFNFFLGVDSFEKNATTLFEKGKLAAKLAPRDSDTLGMYGNTGLKLFFIYNEWGDSVDVVTGQTGRVIGEKLNASGNFEVDCTVGTPVFNGRNSGLWDMVADVWKSELAEMYTVMRSNGLTAQKIWEKAESFWAKWCEALYCVDAMGYANTGKFGMAHGDKREIIRYFLKGRQRYMDSKYVADKSSPLVLRLWGRTDGMVLKYAQPIYASLNYGAGETDTERCIVPETPAYFPTKGREFNETTVTAYHADLLTEISTYKEDAEGAKIGMGLDGTFSDIEVVDISNCRLLKKLNLNFAGRTSTKLNNNVCAVGNSIALEECVINNASGVTQRIDFKSKCLRKVDLTNTNVPSIGLVSGCNIESIKLGAKTDDICLVDLPYLKSFSVQGHSNIKTLVIRDCPFMHTTDKNGLPHSYTLIKSIIDTEGNLLEEVEINDINWSQISVATLRKIANIKSVKLKGRIELADGEKLTYADKLALEARFGDIDHGTNGLVVVYKAIALESVVRADSRVYFTEVGDYKMVPALNPISANTIKRITWSISDNPYATITTDGVLSVARVDTEDNKDVAKATVTCSMLCYQLTDDGGINFDATTPIQGTSEIRFYEHKCAVGDLVYADGSFSDVYDPSKTVIGLCAYVDANNPSQRWMSSMGDLGNYIWGLSNGLSNFSNPNYNPYDIPALTNVNQTQVLAEIGFAELTTDTLGFAAGTMMPYGKINTLAIIQHRNTILSDPGVAKPIPPLTGVDNSLVTLKQYMSAVSKGTQLYYAAASICYHYEPQVREGETLNPKFRAGQWFLPSAAELKLLSQLHREGYSQSNLAPFALGAAKAGFVPFCKGGNSYWSSDENYQQCAWLVSVASGALDFYGSKDVSSYVVRALAAF